MNIETQRTLEIIHELQRHGWKRDRAAELTGTPFGWRDPAGNHGLFDMFGALRIVRERESAESAVSEP